MKAILSLNLCACDCGGYVAKPENKFIRGHNKKNTKLSQKTKDSIRESLIGVKHSKERRKNISLALTGRKQSEEHKKNTGLAQRGIPKSPESNEKRRISNTGKKRSEQTRDHIRASLNIPKILEKIKINANRPEIIEKKRAQAIKQREDPNCNFGKGINKKTFNTSIELIMKAIFEKLHVPYIHQKKIESKTVDFFIPHKNLVVECDGTYWHSRANTKENDAKRDVLFRTLGYTVKRLTEVRIKELKIIYRVKC